MMYINNNSHLQWGMLSGFAFGILHYDPSQDGNIEIEEEEYWDEIDILIGIFFLKITRW